MSELEYLGRIGYKRGEMLQGLLIHTMSQHVMKDKKVILFGAGMNAFYAETMLKEKGIELFGYVDNLEKLWGSKLRGKSIYSPYELFKSDEYYYIITVCQSSINQVRLQLLAHGIQSYGIFIDEFFHDFSEQDERLQEILLEAINIICFENEESVVTIPYSHGGDWQPARLNFLLWSTLWAHWAYLWEKEEIERNKYKEILEIGPGYGLMSLVLLTQFQDIHIDWMLMEGESGEIAENSRNFESGLRKVREKYSNRINEIFCSVERDYMSSKKYDLIILTEVFEHFAINPVEVMGKLVCKLEKGGKIILTTPNWGHLYIYQSWEEIPYNEGVSDARYKELLRCGHTYQYNKQELITIFNRVGLDIEKYNLSDNNNHNFVLVKHEQMPE